MEEMDKFILPVGKGGVWQQGLWEVLRGSGPVCPAFRIGFVGHNFPILRALGILHNRVMQRISFRMPW